MRIEYWFDYTCPFCYIGRRRLQNVLRELCLEECVQMLPRSFELDQNAPTQVRYSMEEIFALKYKISLAVSNQRVRQISETGKQEGIRDMDYAGSRPTNTLDAHRLTKYADKSGFTGFADLLYQAHFCGHLNVGEKDVLLRIADGAGMERGAVQYVLYSDAYLDEVREDEKLAEKMGIQLVPHFILDGQVHISGVKGREEFKELLEAGNKINRK